MYIGIAKCNNCDMYESLLSAENSCEIMVGTSMGVSSTFSVDLVSVSTFPRVYFISYYHIHLCNVVSKVFLHCLYLFLAVVIFYRRDP